MILILGYTMHIFITASSHHVACKIAVIGSLFIRSISCWNTPQNAGNSLSELQETDPKFSGRDAPTPL
jgi:hypothetical protein